MAVAIVLSVSLILLLVFVLQPKNMHLFEILFDWMVFIFIYGDFFGVITARTERLTNDPNEVHIWSYFCIRFIIFPLIAIWLLDRLSIPHAWGFKLAVCALAITCLVVTDDLFDRFINLPRGPWHILFLYVEWCAILLMIYSLNRFFRSLSLKDVRRH